MNNGKLIPHSRPTIEDDDIRSVVDVLRSDMVASGAKVTQFENDLKLFIGGVKAQAASSGKVALILALSTLGIQPGDEVIVPTYVCKSVLEAITYVGGKPVIVDIGDDYCISPECIEKSITKKTKAIVVVHIFGIYAPIERVINIARKSGVYVIEDCAHSIGGEIQGNKLGSLGDISFFSFQATKVMASGEGGMLLINNNDLMTDFEKHFAVQKHISVMSDLQAALGISQLKKLPEFIKKRKLLAKHYMKLLRETKELEVPMQDMNKNIFFRFPVKIKKDITFDLIRKKMEETGIHVRKGVDSMLHQAVSGFHCVNADRLFKETVSLPIYPKLDIQDITRIAERLKEVL